MANALNLIESDGSKINLHLLIHFLLTCLVYRSVSFVF